MSGMAGNITAFNTVWTYDLYQSYRRLVIDRPRPATIIRSDGKREDVTLALKDLGDAHYLWMGKAVTVVGTLLSIACAYFASHYANAMDVVQLVFGFVNAPVFATFLLGMFWKRTTGTGAFYGLIGGIATSAVFHSLTIATGNAPGIKGGYLPRRTDFPERNGAEFLARQLCLYRMFDFDRGHFAGHGAKQIR